ncbi:hypothetical protein B5G36_03310 [Ligilactobacillus salivarius]|uniref:Uncharacterized protein n=1 Tax=Ligilactobacillus salivarius TaxID=1624 RepID=A0AB36MJ47_9LACO|nr:hypothetical protein [Ligilactobacillus salivarius]OUN19027.1 hypothetical protein B5G36_03310 [Ligilactobacillus salivarius]
MRYEDFKNEIEKIDNNLSVEKYDEDQIAMIGTTLQDRKAGDVEIFVNEDVSVFRITTDDNDHCFLKISIGVDITSFDTFFEILNLIKEYMENL